MRHISYSQRYRRGNLNARLACAINYDDQAIKIVVVFYLFYTSMVATNEQEKIKCFLIGL